MGVNRVTAGANAVGGLANAVGRLSTDIARLVGIGHLAGGVAGGLGPWAASLQPASWNGIPFAVRASQIRRGRRVAVHEYPFRDDVWVEQWNLANDFIFFACRGEASSNRREDQELSMLSLHRLQNCMVYVNTLMEQVLARPAWQGRLSARDLHALTPLFWTHVNPYGRFELDMRTRINALA